MNAAVVTTTTTPTTTNTTNITLTPEQLVARDEEVKEALKKKFEGRHGLAPSILQQYGFSKTDVGAAVKAVAKDIFTGAVIVGTVAGGCLAVKAILFPDGVQTSDTADPADLPDSELGAL